MLCNDFVLQFIIKNVFVHEDLMSKAKSLACFLDTSTTNEIADGVKYNQEERAGAGHAFLLLRDYLKFAEGADFNLKSP